MVRVPLSQRYSVAPAVTGRGSGPNVVGVGVTPGAGGASIPGGGLPLDALIARQKQLAGQQIPLPEMQSPMQGVGYVAQQVMQGLNQGRADRDLREGRTALAQAMTQFDPNTGEFTPEAMQVMGALMPEEMLKSLHDMAVTRREDARLREQRQQQIDDREAGYRHESDVDLREQKQAQDALAEQRKYNEGQQTSDRAYTEGRSAVRTVTGDEAKALGGDPTRTYQVDANNKLTDITVKKSHQLTPEEAAAKGYRPGTMVEVDESGNETVLQSPEAPRDSFGKVVTGPDAKALGLNPDKSYQINERTGKYDEVGGGGTTVNTGEKMADWISNDAGYFQRASLAALDLDQVDDALAGKEAIASQVASKIPFGEFASRFFNSDDYKRAQTAGDAWIRAVLRQESGATIGDSEMAGYRKTYLPQPGDGPDQVAQKRDLRQQAMDALGIGVKGAAPQLYKSITDSVEAQRAARQAVRGGGGGGLPRPQTQEDFAKLPKGAHYIDPEDGKEYIK